MPPWGSMITVVHHALDATAGELSPFVQRIHAIAEGSELRIACPYIGLRVLRPVLSVARGWRLLTDAEELLRSQAPSQVAELVKFLGDNEKHVRHWPGLHAKVVAGDGAVLIGSANLTEMGLGKRQEMAVVLDDPAVIAQVHEWFDALWSCCRTVSSSAMSSFVQALPRTVPQEPGLHLESPAPQISAMVVVPARRTREESGSEDRLRERLAHGVSRKWVEGYLDLCADLLTALEISEDDARLSMSVPPSSSALPVTINQRYVLCAFYLGRKVIGVMLPHGIEVPDALLPKMTKVRDHLGSFRQWHDEQPGDVPQFAYFEVDHPRELRPLRDDWLDAVLRETQRTWTQSSFRRHHVSAFSCAATEQGFRDSLLDGVFSKRAWWFGVNNGSGGHMQLASCRTFLDGEQAQLLWPIGNSKPKKLYAQMRVGDDVLLWTGHGADPEWGLLGTAKILDVGAEAVVLHDSRPFVAPLTPYPKGQPGKTDEVSFLLRTFGDDFVPLGDVRRAVSGGARTPPVTVAAVPGTAFEAVVARAKKAGS